jgi:hypothetical protein
MATIRVLILFLSISGVGGTAGRWQVAFPGLVTPGVAGYVFWMTTMKKVLALAVVACWSVPGCTPGPSLEGVALASLEAPELERIWSEALPWDRFHETLGEAAEPWDRAYREAVIREDFEARAGVLPGVHRMLAVAEADCPECAATLPALARLAAQVPGMELRVARPELADPLFEPGAEPASLPVVVVLDGSYRDVGCWISEPRADPRADAWALDQVILVMEDAGRGLRRCPATSPG